VPIAEEVRQLAKEIGDAERAFQASFLGHVASLTLGDRERAVSLMEEFRVANVLKQPALQWWSLAMQAIWALFRGDFPEGERLADEALRVGRHAQSWDAGFSHRMALFILHREQGGLDEIDELIQRSVDEYPGYRLFRCLVPLLDSELGRSEKAAAKLEALSADEFAAVPPDAEYLFSLCILSEVAAELGDAERADTLRRLLEPYKALNALASGEVSLGCVARFAGLAAATAERWQDAERHFTEALEANARMEARPSLAHTQHDHGRMLLARGDRSDLPRARELLANALDTYRELGMKPWVKRAEADVAGLD
jgi:tetratricopeptide (TPR) repeat protein